MMSASKSGRLVLNHSTHIKGLIPLLQKLLDNPAVSTITPGRLARVRGRPTPLRLRVTVPIRGGFKVVVRSEGSVQEVFILTSMSASELQAAVDAIRQTK